MVNIAVAGGSGSAYSTLSSIPANPFPDVATEFLRAPLATGNHSVTILTRSSPSKATPGVSYKKVDYHDLPSLTEALRGFDVVLSFLVVHLDTDSKVQKNLIHACIDAGVKRFAPSEWGIKNNSGVPYYDNKDKMARYLAEINAEKQVLEYCLFQPSIFMDYFAHPYAPSSDLFTWPFFIDLENRRAMVLDAGDQPIVLTAIADDSAILSLALDDPRPWPAVGGIRGAPTCINEILELAQKIRGGEWSIEHISGEDIKRGELKSSWVPILTHPTIPVENREQFSTEFVIMFFRGILNGGWNVSGEWNERFPEFKFQGLEEFLRKAWEGKP
jgi:hypothetical protein